MLAKSRAEKRSAREPKLTDGGGEAFMPDDWSVAESSSTWGVVNVDSSDAADPTEELRVPSSKLPWQICMFLVHSHITLSDQLPSLREWRPDNQLYGAVS